jgi:hypothetical protein
LLMSLSTCFRKKPHQPNIDIRELARSEPHPEEIELSIKH